MTELDVGRITFVTILNPDGTVKCVDVHDPAVTATYTLDGTDKSVTLFLLERDSDLYGDDAIGRWVDIQGGRSVLGPQLHHPTLRGPSNRVGRTGRLHRHGHV
ncbi:MAG TPA: hypothetical protein VF065_09875 [Ilumatobacter sp.]